MSIPQMSEAELDAYLQEVADHGSDEELEALINTIKGLNNDYIFARQKAVIDEEMDKWHMRQAKEAQNEIKLREERVKHERRIQAAEDLLRKERSWDPSRGTR